MNKWLIGIGLFSIYSIYQRFNNNPKVYFLENIPFGFNGLALPPFGIFIKKVHRYNPELILHELVHWEQFRRQGSVLFLANYLIANRNGYDNNPLEIEARFRESDFCKQNYTYCVRNGLAKTIHHPNFRK